MLRGFVEELSIPKIAKNCDLSTKTVWLAKTKVNQAIMTMYGYTDLFRGNTQADEYYTRTAFKGKRDPEFFIYILRRMPRHHYTYYEKIEWLENAGLYEKLQREEPELSIPMQKCILFGNSEHPFPEKQSIPFRSRVQLMISTQVESLYHVM